MARPPRFGPGRQPLLRQKKHARRLNKITSVKIAGLVGTVQFQTLPTVNINMAPVLSVPTIIYGAAKLQGTSRKQQAQAHKWEGNPPAGI
jgi:hypothetical protein